MSDTPDTPISQQIRQALETCLHPDAVTALLHGLQIFGTELTEQETALIAALTEIDRLTALLAVRDATIAEQERQMTFVRQTLEIIAGRQ